MRVIRSCAAHAQHASCNRHRPSESGHTFVELLFVAGILAVAAATSVPAITGGVERSRARAAARYLAGQMSMARTEAVARSAPVALRFRADARGVLVDAFVDGNRNGVRAADIADGTDRPMQPPARLDDLFPGVLIGVPVDSPDSPVMLGGSEILTFTPNGTASSGTIHVLGRDGSRFAVRVLGVTARVRVLRFDDRSGRWVEAL